MMMIGASRLFYDVPCRIHLANLKDRPAPGGKHASLNEMIMNADGFAGGFPKYKYEIVKRLQGLGHLHATTGHGANDAPALPRANGGIGVKGATDAAGGAADIILTESGLSTIVHAICGYFQRMCNYSIYTFAVTIRTVVCLGILAANMTPSVDRAVAYGLYRTLAIIAFVIIILETSFFQGSFGLSLDSFIFVTRWHGFLFVECLSTARLGAVCVAQLISSIIVYGIWGFQHARCFRRLDRDRVDLGMFRIISRRVLTTISTTHIAYRNLPQAFPVFPRFLCLYASPYTADPLSLRAPRGAAPPYVLPNQLRTVLNEEREQRRGERREELMMDGRNDEQQHTICDIRVCAVDRPGVEMRKRMEGPRPAARVPAGCRRSPSGLNTSSVPHYSEHALGDSLLLLVI
ncbi:hypothetical protein K438DRAFT_2015720 [Mycena galopus ATCC 62051]|nr:hypothetical protein K438DRAFT_2015720 [Mycena galopus ATCC 62051]